MKESVREWLDSLFAYEEVSAYASEREAAADIQYMRESGMDDIPADLTAHDLFVYCNAHAKKPERPLNVYEIQVSYIAKVSYYVEAHNQDEAANIFDSWQELHTDEIMEELIDNSEGYGYGLPYLKRPGAAMPMTRFIDWNTHGEKLLSE